MTKPQMHSVLDLFNISRGSGDDGKKVRTRSRLSLHAADGRRTARLAGCSSARTHTRLTAGAVPGVLGAALCAPCCLAPSRPTPPPAQEKQVERLMEFLQKPEALGTQDLADKARPRSQAASTAGRPLAAAAG